MVTILFPPFADAHRSGCHRWHSCPSDSGSYTCGDTGYCSQCPNNQYCENGQPKLSSSPFSPEAKEEQNDSTTILSEAESNQLSPSILKSQDMFDEAAEDYNRGDYKLAFQKLQFLADQGDAEVQLTLGYMYRDGKGVAQDDPDAVEWFRKAAKQGHAQAQFELGEFYYVGSRKIPQDYYEAVDWYRKAAAQGLAKAQLMLGGAYTLGKGVQRNDREGEKWIRRAAEQGHGAAQLSLGAIYEEGRGVPQDKHESLKWYRKAVQVLRKNAEQGDGMAQFSLGLMYVKGRGTIQDYVEAHKWLNLAVSRGVPEAVQQRGLLAPLMTSSQLAKAQELARNWRPNKTPQIR